jgi:hypothetical protein
MSENAWNDAVTFLKAHPPPKKTAPEEEEEAGDEERTGSALLWENAANEDCDPMRLLKSM